MSRPEVPGAERWALLALALLAAVTAGWWALALWPTAEAPPAWLARARWVCFNAGPDGLPEASGWLLLVGQPLGLLAVLMAVWGDRVRGGLRGLARSGAGRAALGACAGLLVLGLVASGARVVGVASARAAVGSAPELPPDTYPRLDRAAPALSLVDQRGRVVRLADLHGRPALVTFAFGHCETICPAVVHRALEAQRELRRRAAGGAVAPAAVPRLVIVSLDPWRDTPSRLPHMARGWQLGDDAHLLSGEVAEVEAVLDAWRIPRQRDRTTGDVTHPPLVYLLDGEGRIAYATRGDTAAVVELLGRI